MDTSSSPKSQRERSIFSSVKLLPNPPQYNQQRRSFAQNVFPDKSNYGNGLVATENVQKKFQRTPYCKIIHDMSSSLMDVLRYNMVQVPPTRRAPREQDSTASFGCYCTVGGLASVPLTKQWRILS
jgi:hypothetical protein